LKRREKLNGNENKGSLFEWLTLHGRKDKPTAAYLKRLWAWKGKNIVVRKKGIWANTTVTLIKSKIKNFCLHIWWNETWSLCVIHGLKHNFIRYILLYHSIHLGEPMCEKNFKILFRQWTSRQNFLHNQTKSSVKSCACLTDSKHYGRWRETLSIISD